MKKLLAKEVATEDAYILEGPLDEVIERLKKLKEKHPNFQDLHLSVAASHCWECSGEIEIKVSGNRFETDKEESFRINRSKITKEAAKKRKERERQVELEEYERLKKKFETNSVE